MPANPDDTLRTSALLQRFQPLLWLGVTFLTVSALTRLALLLVTDTGVPASPSLWAYAFGVGFGYDLLTLLYFALPLLLWLWLMPTRWLLARSGRVALGALCLLLLCVMLFVALSEWTFWEEFQTRFNFIAVDYLVYTTEVIGNIRESYPVGWLLTGLGVIAGAIFYCTRRWHRVQDTGTTFAGRSMVTAAWLLLTVLGTWLVDADLKDRSDNQYVNELAGNGIYQFFAAYRSASLDYARFYRSLPLDQAFVQVRRQLRSPDAHFVGNNPVDITRDIHNAAPERKLNVVLISVESLSASYSGSYGRVPSLTPQLDALSKDSLLFTRLFATGTRTVRGLEALSLSVPPTPGESIVKRRRNECLSSLAEVFNGKGYVSQFLYGGYGAFDNMNYFFAHNGYQVHDREQIDKQAIHHANIWGVADEDLYTMALGEFDKANATGKPFFAHVMTTSNHRPYTFPQGRGPWPQGKRESAVAYTDWAIGDLLRRARTKPWFANTVFVITADHCASSGGKASLPVFRYHIPMWIYSPDNIAPGRWSRLTSQIDIAPTLLGLLGMDYRSRFYGVDVMQQTAGSERAFLGTYQLLGYLRNEQLIQLAPHRRADAVSPSYGDDRPQPRLPLDSALALEAVSYYQTASYRFAHGLMVEHPDSGPLHTVRAPTPTDGH
ncbi:MAG: sulfatase-like hydrolase/transferase [Lysobacter sp.]|nr:sulfatase-like hydrolase/transferase [Lysobacter sp.]